MTGNRNFALALLAARSVELLAATRPFRLELFTGARPDRDR